MSVFNTVLDLNITGKNVVAQVDKIIQMDIETKTEQLYQIKSSDGWKEIDFSSVDNIKLIIFNSTVDETEFKVRMTFYIDVEDEVLVTGDGSTVTFSNTLSNSSIQEETVSITYTLNGTEYTAIDDGSGVISGTGISSGTINYTTSKIDLTFSSAPDVSTDIEVTYAYLDISHLVMLEIEDIFIYSPASTFEDNVNKLEIATDTTSDVEVMVQVLGVSS